MSTVSMYAPGSPLPASRRKPEAGSRKRSFQRLSLSLVEVSL